MIEALRRVALVLLLLGAAPAPAFAQQDSDDADEALDQSLLLPPDLFLPGPTNSGRKDVREVTMPPPPSGPATPVPYCGPSAPVCP